MGTAIHSSQDQLCHGAARLPVGPISVSTAASTLAVPSVPAFSAGHPRWTLGLAAATMAMTLLASGPAAAAYPEKPVKIVVGFAAGGNTDQLARILAKGLTDTLGQPFTVENKPGAAGNMAADYAAKASADGSVLFMAAVNSAINYSLVKKSPFDLLKDFAPVGMMARVPNVLVVNSSVPAKTAQELADYLKRNPGKLTFASSGLGTSIHMAGEMFKQRADVDAPHVAYRGSAPALADLMANQAQFMFDNLPSSLPHVRSGKLRALAVTSAERSTALPNVPTMIESGFAGFNVTSWTGVLAPAKTSPDIVNTLNAAIGKVLDSAEVRQQLEALGAVGMKQTPAAFGAFIKTDVDQWAKVVKASGVTVD